MNVWNHTHPIFPLAVGLLSLACISFKAFPAQCKIVHKLCKYMGKGFFLSESKWQLYTFQSSWRCFDFPWSMRDQLQPAMGMQKGHTCSKIILKFLSLNPHFLLIRLISIHKFGLGRNFPFERGSVGGEGLPEISHAGALFPNLFGL